MISPAVASLCIYFIIFNVVVLVYHLIGYGLILWLLNTILGRKVSVSKELHEYPTVTILCPAFNEERDLDAKIQSFLKLDYPPEKIKMIVISDDSTDRTNEIASQYSDKRVQLLVQKPRRGKQAAHNLALSYIDSDYVLSTDATAIFEPQSLKLLMQAMRTDKRIGLVSGRLKLIKGDGRQSGEGLYIRYEGALRAMDSRFHSVLVAVGALFLIKTELFTYIHEGSADDFERTLQVLDKGYKAKFLEEAAVVETESEHAHEELSRKVRIITQQWYCIFRNLGVINPFKHPLISWMLLSHKVLRWLFFIPVILIWLLLMILAAYAWIWLLLFIVMTLGVALGAWELRLQARALHIPGMGIPAYFVAMLLASIIAFVNILKGKQFGTWDNTR